MMVLIAAVFAATTTSAAAPKVKIGGEIGAKFPTEDYQRLVEAQERGDTQAVEAASRQLENRIKGCAGDISSKYVNPPKTTDFGVLFLPTEGLFAEVVRRPGLIEMIHTRTGWSSPGRRPSGPSSTACGWASARWRSNNVPARCGACSRR